MKRATTIAGAMLAGLMLAGCVSTGPECTGPRYDGEKARAYAERMDDPFDDPFDRVGNDTPVVCFATHQLFAKW